MAIGKRQVWREGDTFKARDGNLYFVTDVTERTVTVMRVAWMWDKDDDLALSSVTEPRERGNLYTQLTAKYTQELELHRSSTGRQDDYAAEYLVLEDGSTLRSNRRLGPTALERLRDAAGVTNFRLVRSPMPGPITSPTGALMRKYNEYSAISPDDPGNPKLHAIFGAMCDLLEEAVLPPELVEAFVAKIESEFRNFHAPSASCKELETWRTQRHIQLLYSDSVMVNRAYLKRGERYVRRMITENSGELHRPVERPL